MSVLELARKAFDRVKARRNGHPEIRPDVPKDYERNEKSPPADNSEVCPCDGRDYEINERYEERSPEPLAEPAATVAPVIVVREQQAGSPFKLVKAPGDLPAVLAAIEESTRVALDIETTGLNPRQDRLRLLSLATDGKVWLLDCFQVMPEPLFEILAERTLIGHNLAFDLAFLWQLGFRPGPVRDTMLLSQLLYGTRKPRGFHSLAGCAERELGRTLKKDLQKSDWSGPLTFEQLAYATTDVKILGPLVDALEAKIREANLSQAADIECRCLPALVWLSSSGVPLDTGTWKALALNAEEEAAELALQLDASAPPPPQRDLMGGGWNWDSAIQVKQALAVAGCRLDSTADEALAAVNHPLATLLRRYRAASKKVSTYGTDWLANVASDGRVYPDWRQIGSDAGRMSCRSPNMQQLPRGDYRRCVRAPKDRVLVKADYSQIELRIAAKIANDAAMLDAYRQGLDLHTLTARQLLGKEDVTKADRQIAKSANFGLLYGMGVRGYRTYARTQFGLEMTEAEAARYRQAFFAAYPGLAGWHAQTRQRRATESRTLVGRRRLFDKKTPDTHRLNSPVQGTGADGLKAALVLLWERRGAMPGTFPVLAVHDEIVLECPADQAEAAAAWLRQAMLDGMAPLVEPVTVEVEVKTAPTWGG
jgi:DNA polymerase-1